MRTQHVDTTYTLHQASLRNEYCGALCACAAHFYFKHYNSYSLLHNSLSSGVWQWEIAIERESADDETTCLGVALWPISWANYESSHEMWLVSWICLYFTLSQYVITISVAHCSCTLLLLCIMVQFINEHQTSAQQVRSLISSMHRLWCCNC
jgi:hypothetical protein